MLSLVCHFITNIFTPKKLANLLPKLCFDLCLTIFSRHHRVAGSVNRATMDRFPITLTLVDNEVVIRTEEATAAVEQGNEDPNESKGHRPQQLELCPSTLRKHLEGYLFAVFQIVQESKPNKHQARRKFAEWLKSHRFSQENFGHICLNAMTV